MTSTTDMGVDTADAGDDGRNAAEVSDQSGESGRDEATDAALAEAATAEAAEGETTATEPDSPASGAPDNSDGASPDNTEAAAPDDDSSEPSSSDSDSNSASGTRGADRRVLIAAAAALLGCAALIGYGIWDSPREEPKRAVPTAEVTYQVTGEGPVDITYLARSEKGKATVDRNATLPWKKTVRVPLGQEPSVSIILGEDGGNAGCKLAIKGKHIRSSTAFGPYGRATCSGTLPKAPTEDPAG